MKKAVVLFILLSLSLVLSANEITKIGVVDLAKVYQRYLKDSAAARKIDELKEQVAEDVSERKIEIEKLEKELEEATNDDLESRIEELQSEITIKKSNLQQFYKHKKNEINQLIVAETVKDDFATKVENEVKRIALQKGFSIILNVNDNNILYADREIDITELVIQGLTE